MKKTLLLSAALATASISSAQMADFRICPDWTGTDLNGVSHNLYTYLDQGYTVIVDVSATWCGPCWSYHNSHALRTLYNTYGPGTAQDKVMVFFVEGDGSTTLANLNGSGANTQGDWVEGTTYPIIDNASIANTLEIGYFPTVYRICPNRMITEVGALSSSALWNSCQQCFKYEADTPADATVLPNVGAVASCIGTPVPVTVRLQNTGTAPLTSANLEARRGTELIGTANWSGSLDSYELATVDFGMFSPITATNNITFNILTPDDEATNNSVVSAITADNTIMPTVNVVLELKTDNYPAETTWKLFDGDGNVVDQDPAGNYAAATIYTENWALNDNECYRFEIYDGANDGICCDYGTGYFRLKANGVNIITGGQFDDIDIEPYKTAMSTAVEENLLENGLAIYPNPNNGRVNVNVELPAATLANISVTNVLGAVVYQATRQFNAGAQTSELDLSSLADGTYSLNILADGMTATRKVTITR